MPGAADIIKDYVTEFSRLQNWMLMVQDTNPEAYKSMYERYLEIKVTLNSLGVHLSEIDRIAK